MDQPVPGLVSPLEPAPKKSAKLPLIITGLIIVLAGIGTGFFLQRGRRPSAPSDTSAGMVKSATEGGSTDTKTFRDSAQGVLELGGFNGEGTHKLIREGGPSKTAYLVSSIVDLDEFVGKKLEVWGETMKAQKVGWLMDVGRVKILD